MRSDAGCDVLFVAMPFGPLIQPSIGLSLLRAGLPEYDVRIRYFTLDFAERIGPEVYSWISVLAPNDAILGEWIFGGALFPRSEAERQRYVNEVLRASDGSTTVPQPRIEQILAAEAAAAAFVEACLEQVAALRPRVVGFSNVFAQQVASLALARRIKESSPDTAVIFGGANCEGVMGAELVQRFDCIDAAVSGEGDLVIEELVGRLLAGESVEGLPGVYTRSSVGAWQEEHGDGAAPPEAPRVPDLDALPLPDYTDFFAQWEPSEAARRYDPVVLFETSRGCWWGDAHHCTFCGLNGSSMTYRSKTAVRALEELRHLSVQHPDVFVMAVDNILDVRYFRDLVPALANEPELKLDLFYALKANLKREQLQALRDAGIGRIQPGIESLSDGILRLMRKGETGLQNVQLLKWCSELGVHAAWNFLWGFPGEPPAEYTRMAEMVPLLSHLTPPQIAKSVRLDRFSPNYEQGTELGFRDIVPCRAYSHIYPFPPESLERLAYHFEFDYADGRDVDAYTAPLATAIDRWQRDHAESQLFFQDRGDELWLWDLRPGLEQGLERLRGEDRLLYLECDSARSLRTLARRSGELLGREWSEERISGNLQRLVERGWMLRDDDRYLSLAVSRRDPASARRAG